jgi:siroheme synthase-like protein
MPLDSPTYPVALVLAGRRCLVVGGGRVALRKAQGLLAAHSVVTVVAPEIDERVAALPVTVERRPYAAGEAAAYFLVVTATGRPEVDRAVYADGERAGVLVNAADDLAGCSFILPAVLRRGPVSVAVSTDGTSPALASWLRDRIAEIAGPGLAELAALLGGARDAVRATGRSSEDVAWRALLDGPLPRLVAAGDEAGARAEIGRWLAAELGEREVVGERGAVRPEAPSPED